MPVSVSFDIDGRRIAGLASGDAGPPLLFLHGFGSDRMSWFLNQGAASSWARTLALDLPGHGASDMAVGDGTVFHMAGVVAGTIEAWGQGPVHVAGHSFGGATALALADARPDLVASLVLVAPAGVGARVNADFLAAYTGMTDVDDAMAALQRLVARPRLISRQMASRVLEGMERPGHRAALVRIAAALETLPDDLTPAVERIGHSPLPRRLVWGLADGVSPFDPARTTRLDAPTTLVPEVGHLPHMENAPLVNDLLREAVTGV